MDAAVRLGYDAPLLAAIAGRLARAVIQDMRRVDGLLSKEQVISFFFELAQAYVSARFFGDVAADGAMDVALARLQIVDAARTFAFAEVAQRIGTGDTIEIEKIDLVPGAYTPQAVVRLKVAHKADKASAKTFVMQLRLEWGDWYVAELQSVGLG